MVATLPQAMIFMTGNPQIWSADGGQRKPPAPLCRQERSTVSSDIRRGAIT
jgi:hypothetical protein